MPLFDYKCVKGHLTESTTRAEAIMCGSDCSEIARRRFSFRIARSIQPHYNAAVGDFVRNEQDFRDKLKRAAERQAVEIGYETTYDYIDPADIATQPEAFGVTEEGLYETRKRQHDASLAGLTPEEYARRETQAIDTDVC
jgi:hypothetical protein